MLWFDNTNIIRLSFIRKNERGIATASAGIRDKKADGSTEYVNVNVRFSADASQKLFNMLQPGQDKLTITVLKGGVDIRNSSKYKNERGKPLPIPTLAVNDFEIKEWNNSQPRQSAPQYNSAPQQPAPQPPQFDGDDNPFGI